MNFTNTDCVACLDDWDIPEEFWDIEAADVFCQVFRVTYQIKYRITKINFGTLLTKTNTKLQK